MVTVVIKQLTTVLLLGAVSLSIAGPDGSPKTAVLAEGPRDASASELGVGRLVPDVTIKPIAGKSFRLSQAKPKGALVLAFTSTSCPVANRYAPALAAIEKQFRLSANRVTIENRQVIFPSNVSEYFNSFFLVIIVKRRSRNINDKIRIQF